MSAITILLLWQHSRHPPRVARQSPGSLQAFPHHKSLLPPGEAPCTTPASCPPARAGLQAAQQGRNHRAVPARQAGGWQSPFCTTAERPRSPKDTSTHNRIQIYWNTHFQNFCLLAFQMRTKSASRYRKVCAPQKAPTKLQPKLKKNPVSKMILKRVKSVPSAPQGSSVGAVATGGESRGLTSSESCIPKAAGTVCTENPSSALLLQASCKGASLPPPDLTSFGIKTSGQLHFLSLGSAWEVPG